MGISLSTLLIFVTSVTTPIPLTFAIPTSSPPPNPIRDSTIEVASQASSTHGPPAGPIPRDHPPWHKPPPTSPSSGPLPAPPQPVNGPGTGGPNPGHSPKTRSLVGAIRRRNRRLTRLKGLLALVNHEMTSLMKDHASDDEDIGSTTTPTVQMLRKRSLDRPRRAGHRSLRRRALASGSQRIGDNSSESEDDGAGSAHDASGEAGLAELLRFSLDELSPDSDKQEDSRPDNLEAGLPLPSIQGSIGVSSDTSDVIECTLPLANDPSLQALTESFYNMSKILTQADHDLWSGWLVENVDALNATDTSSPQKREDLGEDRGESSRDAQSATGGVGEGASAAKVASGSSTTSQPQFQCLCPRPDVNY